ncbi:glutathione binding-like protein [Paraburkholderia youngii]|uniref:glutathione binding-like protein n=1 Tax=Paraburkholderia youngii TaxID=2782701 RepID=UPI003D1AC3C7
MQTVSTSRTGSLQKASGPYRHEKDGYPFKRYAADQTYGLTRYTKEVYRLYKVLDGQLEKNQFVAGDEYSFADIAIYPWIARFELHDLEWSVRAERQAVVRNAGARGAVKRAM